MKYKIEPEIARNHPADNAALKAENVARRSEEALHTGEQRMCSLLESLPLGVYECDTNGVITLANETFARMMGRGKDEVLGRKMADFMEPGPQREALSAHLKQLIREQPAPKPFFCREITKEGRSFDAQVDWTYKRDESGRLTGFVCVLSDISERRELERMKDDIFATVSHEMRTPLTAMLGFTEFLLENDVDEAQSREFLGTIYKETERLHELINNFLDLQRLKTRQGVYHFEILAVAPLLYESALLFASASKTHRIAVNVPSDLPPVKGDEVRLHQVFNNLLCNAIKFSPKGGTISLGAQQNKDAVVVWVQDEGIGIPPEMLEKIFDRFYRVDSTDSRRTGGTGLGLALVKEIVTAHGGGVWVESEVGKGSTFHVSLPVGQEEHGLQRNTKEC